jgi:cytochrome bd-type quinol oxidase subunit 2
LWIAIPLVAGFAFWTHLESERGFLPGPVEVTAFLLIVAAAWSVRDGHSGWGFTATTAALAATIVALFVHLYPNVMVSTTNSAYNLTAKSTASGAYALKVMTVVAVIFACHRLPSVELPHLPGPDQGTGRARRGLVVGRPVSSRDRPGRR